MITAILTKLGIKHEVNSSGGAVVRGRDGFNATCTLQEVIDHFNLALYSNDKETWLPYAYLDPSLPIYTTDGHEYYNRKLAKLCLSRSQLRDILGIHSEAFCNTDVVELLTCEIKYKAEPDRERVLDLLEQL